MFVDVHASQKRRKENFADCIANCVKWLSTSWNFCNLLQEFLKLLICDRWSHSLRKVKENDLQTHFTTTVSLSSLSFWIFFWVEMLWKFHSHCSEWDYFTLVPRQRFWEIRRRFVDSGVKMCWFSVFHFISSPPTNFEKEHAMLRTEKIDFHALMLVALAYELQIKWWWWWRK